jgi:hypothetical protein
MQSCSCAKLFLAGWRMSEMERRAILRQVRDFSIAPLFPNGAHANTRSKSFKRLAVIKPGDQQSASTICNPRLRLVKIIKTCLGAIHPSIRYTFN